MDVCPYMVIINGCMSIYGNIVQASSAGPVSRGRGFSFHFVKSGRVAPRRLSVIGCGELGRVCYESLGLAFTRRDVDLDLLELSCDLIQFESVHRLPGKVVLVNTTPYHTEHRRTAQKSRPQHTRRRGRGGLASASNDCDHMAYIATVPPSRP